jgi:acetyl-CoA hydrolase/succinyl-CoA:acetate CoA-transferase
MPTQPYSASLTDKLMTPEEAAELIQDGEVIATSGFTPAGYPKVIPVALARRARALHEDGKPFKVTLYTGASVGDEIDGEFVRANMLHKRLPYQSNAELRNQINAGTVEFIDFHLSHVAPAVRSGALPKPTTVIIEAVDVLPDGKIYLSASGGATATYLMMADRILIEKNSYYGHGLKGYHDIFIPQSRQPLPIYSAGDRIGTPYVQVSPDKIVGIVETCLQDSMGGYAEADEASKTIAQHILDFLKFEKKHGRLPDDLPYQSGVGNVANAVLASMARDASLPPVSLYTEVVQDSIFDLLEYDKLQVASTCALAFSKAGQEKFKGMMEDCRSKFIVRQQEITNNPEIVRRLGLISMNTALEADIFGNVNSTHVLGSKLMNGIGGSGDFTRNCFLPIFMTVSTAKNNTISAIVPMVTHVDHSEHSTEIFVTEQGLADLRGKDPVARARTIISQCAHPLYKDMLTEFLDYGLKHAPGKHTPIVLSRAFEMHQRFIDTGSMLPA